LAFATASMERVLAVDMTKGTVRFAAALAVASSPFLCRIPCTPTGAVITGERSLTPTRSSDIARLVLGVDMRSATYIKIAMGSIAKHTGG
jgi:hypothetical protein